MYSQISTKWSKTESHPSCHKGWIFNFQWVALLPVYIRVPQLNLSCRRLSITQISFCSVGNFVMTKKHLLELLLVSCGWHARTHLVQSPKKVHCVKPHNILSSIFTWWPPHTPLQLSWRSCSPCFSPGSASLRSSGWCSARSCSSLSKASQCLSSDWWQHAGTPGNYNHCNGFPWPFIHTFTFLIAAIFWFSAKLPTASTPWEEPVGYV